MLIIGIGGLQLAPAERDWLARPEVSGLTLFSRNFASRQQLQALVASIRELRSDDGFLVCVDQEGGRVQRFRDGFTPLPALARLGALYDSDPGEAVALAEEHAWLMASEMRALDVDMSFAPVVDLARGNRAIGNRALHASATVVTELAQAYLRGMHLAGMAATLKHFPGHGSVAEDTHVDVARDPRTLEVMRRQDLVPFAECIQLGVEAVMMAHVIYPAVDAVPAGQSPVWIGDVLRHELGFAGMVFSDDLSMAGAGGDMAGRVATHLAAGCDLLLACQPGAVEAALAAVNGLAPCDAGRVAALRGQVAASWDGLQDNPQRDRFIARVTALDQDQA